MSVSQVIIMIALVATLWGQPRQYVTCVVEAESEYRITAVGDHNAPTGTSVGLFMFQKETAEYALELLGIAWDWEVQGDPRLDPYVNTVMAMALMDEGYYYWWSTDGQCSHLR